MKKNDKSPSLNELLKQSDYYKQSSMLKWYPLIKDLPIPQPETFIVEIPYSELINMLDGNKLPDKYIQEIENVYQILGCPLFLRTDNSSQKHSWKDTCFVETGDDLFNHIYTLIDSNGASDLVDNAIVLREFIPMHSTFNAFWGEFPVSREMRHFIRDGKVQCKHWYWFDEVMRKQGRPKDSQWELKLQKLNTLTTAHQKIIDDYLEIVCGAFPEGYWSVDFCQGKDGKWYLIDMARGEVSFHYPTCELLEKTQ